MTKLQKERHQRAVERADRSASAAVEKYRALANAAAAAIARRDAAAESLFPVGPVVYWNHGEYTRVATVKAHSGDRVCVQSNRGALYWIATSRVVGVVGI